MSKLVEIDYLRALGVFLVLLIHCTGRYVYLDADSLTYKFWGSVNNAALPAVPLFLFISALVLAYSAAGKKAAGQSLGIIGFYRRRLDKILLPYLAWTVIYLLYNILTSVPIISFTAAPWYFIKEYFLLGKGYYHLYYIIIALQLYLLFPLTERLLGVGKLNEKSEIKHTVIMFLLLCPLAYCFMHFGYTVVYPEFNYIASTLFPYILPIGMGLWFGYDTDRLYRLLDAAGPWLGIGFVLAGALSIVQGVFRLFVIDSTFMIFIRMLYTLFTALFALQLFRRVKSGGRFAKTLTLIGKYSFGIYLSHPLFLNILRNHLHIDKIFNTEIYMFNFTMSVILPMVFAFICSFALSILIRKLKTERFLG